MNEREHIPFKLGQIEDVEKARAGAQAELPIRNIASSPVATEKDKEMLGNLADRASDYAMQ